MSFGKDPSVFSAISQISHFARSLHATLPAAEFVFFATDTSSAAAFVSAFSPSTAASVPKNASISRPVKLCFVQAAEERVTLKRDVASKHAADVDVESVAAALKAAAAKVVDASTPPATIIIRSPKVWPVTFFLAPSGTGEVAMELARPPHRTLIAVFDSSDLSEETAAIEQLLKSVDPTSTRSFFVYAQFSKYLASVDSTRTLNSFFNRSAGSPEDGKIFFVSTDTLTMSEDERAAAEADVFDQLESLQYDLRYERTIGAAKLVRSIGELSWRRLKACVPQLETQLHAELSHAEQVLANASARATSMTPLQLRNAANQYVMDFLQCIEKLSMGTAEGNPARNGQTLDEEKNAVGFAWRAQVDEESIETSVVGHDTRMYGGQQFERVLDEFFKVAADVPMPPVSREEVACSTGPVPVGKSVSADVWAASDLARRALQRVMQPLVEQLLERVQFVLERQLHIVDLMQGEVAGTSATAVGGSAGMSDVADGGDKRMHSMSVLLSPRSSKTASAVAKGNAGDTVIGSRDMSDFPYFKHTVHELYLSFVEELIHKCKEKCSDEFQCAQFVSWDAPVLPTGGASAAVLKTEAARLASEASSGASGRSSSSTKRSKKGKHADESRDGGDGAGEGTSIEGLAGGIFEQMKARLVSNVGCKVHNFVLVPIDALWSSLQSSVSSLSDSELERLFETEATLKKLGRDEAKARAAHAALEKRMSEFSSAAAGIRSADPFPLY